MNGSVDWPVTARRLHRCRTLLMAALLAMTTACAGSFGAGSGAVLEAGRLQADALSMSLAAADAARGNLDAIDELGTLRTRIAARIARLSEGDSALGIPPPGDAQREAMERLASAWGPLDETVEVIVSGADPMLEAIDAAAELSALLPQLQARLDQLARQRAEAGRPATELYSLMLALKMSERMLRSIETLVAGGPRAIAAADLLARDSAWVQRALTGLREGDASTAVERPVGGPERSVLEEAIAAHSRLESPIEALLGNSTLLFEVIDAAETLRYESPNLADTADALAASY